MGKHPRFQKGHFQVRKLFDITRPGRCHVDLIVFQHVSVHVLEIFEPFFGAVETPDRWTTPGGITHSGLVDQVGLRAIFTIAGNRKSELYLN